MNAARSERKKDKFLKAAQISEKVYHRNRREKGLQLQYRPLAGSRRLRFPESGGRVFYG